MALFYVNKMISRVIEYVKRKKYPSELYLGHTSITKYFMTQFWLSISFSYVPGDVLMAQPCNTAAKVDEFFELVQWDPYQIVEITENGEGILSIFFGFILPCLRKSFCNFVANGFLAYLVDIQKIW